MYGYSSIRAENLSSASPSASAYELSGANLPGMTKHQLTLERVASATGNVPVSFIPVGGTVAEAMYEEDGVTPRVIDIATPETIAFDGFFDAIVLDLSGLTGSLNAILESR